MATAESGILNFKIYSLILVLICPCIDTVRHFKDADDSVTWYAERNQYVIALFYDDACSSNECTVLLQLVEQIVESGWTGISELELITVESPTLANKFGLTILPKLIFFRDGHPALYTDTVINEDRIIAWIDNNKDISTKSLYEDDFEHLTQASTGATTGDWFILFYDPEECASLIPLWESVALRLKHKLNVAKVDTSANKKLKDRFKITSCPTIVFLRLNNMYTYDLLHDMESFIVFAEGWYKNAKTEKVPGEPTPFDILVENIVQYMKEYDPAAISFVFGGLVCIILAIAGCIMAPDTTEKAKKKE